MRNVDAAGATTVGGRVEDSPEHGGDEAGDDEGERGGSGDADGAMREGQHLHPSPTSPSPGPTRHLLPEGEKNDPVAAALPLPRGKRVDRLQAETGEGELFTIRRPTAPPPASR